jgi:hypothetical protein
LDHHQNARLAAKTTNNMDEEINYDPTGHKTPVGSSILLLIRIHIEMGCLNSEKPDYLRGTIFPPLTIVSSYFPNP